MVEIVAIEATYEALFLYAYDHILEIEAICLMELVLGLRPQQREVLRARKRRWEEAKLTPNPAPPAKAEFKPKFNLPKLDSYKGRLKGILHQKIFYCLILIFWIVMGCGLARFGRKGLKTTET